ncbi:MAG TPA: hypothetical protein VE449_00845 [Thermoleophilaceae bacterium]|nr:hypothetical protein [Thermoleophilaceae bacterium]
MTAGGPIRYTARGLRRGPALPRRRSRHRELLFYRLLEGAVPTDPHPYGVLTSKSAG